MHENAERRHGNDWKPTENPIVEIWRSYIRLHNEISYTGKTTSLHWIRGQFIDALGSSFGTKLNVNDIDVLSQFGANFLGLDPGFPLTLIL